MIQEEVEAYYLKKPDQVLWPDISQEQTLRLVRKFPSNELKMLYLQRMIGGIFQGADKLILAMQRLSV